MKIPLFLAKFSRFEYWPFLLFYLPVMPYWLWLAFKSRSLTYFTAVNPGIELGGFYGESKTEILKLIEPAYLPKSIFVRKLGQLDLVLKEMHEIKLLFPVVAKPDIGERGNKVAVIASLKELQCYERSCSSSYIIQEFVDFEIELGVLYSRMPNALKGMVTSVARKKFLTVTGDGISNIEQLMQLNLRSRLQIERIKALKSKDLQTVLKKGDSIVLEPIGNHCRGTEFINNNHLINEKLNAVFDDISIPIKGFYFGRFDLKVKCIDDLYQGKNIKIMELNGASSEPGHIYDRQFTLKMAYKDLTYHWKIIAVIAKENFKLGAKPISFFEVVKSLFRFVVLKQ